MGIPENIKRLRVLHDLTQEELGKIAGVSGKAVHTWEAGMREPRMGAIQKMADYFRVSKSDIIEENALDRLNTVAASAPKNHNAKKGVRIKVLGSVAAGVPIEAVEDVIDFEDITEEMALTGTFFGLRIQGDSMSPTIPNGSTVIVRQQSDADTGDIVIAMVNGDDAVCKRLIKYANGITLQSLNPAYEPMDFSNQAILELPVRILGKAVEVRAKL
jgi:repressor LexA